MTELSVDRREVEGIVLLYPQGFINAHTVRLFEGEIQRPSTRGGTGSWSAGPDLSYIASAGLGAIMGVDQGDPGTAEKSASSSLNETVRNIFEILGFNHLYRIYPSEMEAIIASARAGGREARRRERTGAQPWSSGSRAGRSSSARSAR